jgi:hypothetical protein
MTAVADTPGAAGNPSGYMFDAQGTQHVVYRGGDGHIHELWWDAHGWHHTDATDDDPLGFIVRERPGTQQWVLSRAHSTRSFFFRL